MWLRKVLRQTEFAQVAGSRLNTGCRMTCVCANRVLMCLMCGDEYKVDVPLSPLLNHQFHHINKSDDVVMSVTLETYLDEFKRKVEVLAMSYHSATQLKDFLYHGYLLVFSAKRKASLATLKYCLLIITFIIITGVQSYLAKGSIAELSPFTAANGFVRYWPHLLLDYLRTSTTVMWVGCSTAFVCLFVCLFFT